MGWRPSPRAACERHVRYETHQEALEALKRLRGEGQRGLAEFYCSVGPDGGHWHLGRSQQQEGQE
jgi:hypothetical protein